MTQLETLKEDIKTICGQKVKEWKYDSEREEYIATIIIKGYEVQISFKNFDIKGEDLFCADAYSVSVRNEDPLSDRKCRYLIDTLIEEKAKLRYVDEKLKALYDTFYEESVDKEIDGVVIDTIEKAQKEINKLFLLDSAELFNDSLTLKLKAEE